MVYVLSFVQAVLGETELTSKPILIVYSGILSCPHILTRMCLDSLFLDQILDSEKHINKRLTIMPHVSTLRELYATCYEMIGKKAIDPEGI